MAFESAAGCSRPPFFYESKWEPASQSGLINFTLEKPKVQNIKLAFYEQHVVAYWTDPPQ